jgi:hypothetical protein
MLRAQPVPDAGDSQDEHLGAGDGKGIIGHLADKRWEAEWPRIFYQGPLWVDFVAEVVGVFCEQ